MLTPNLPLMNPCSCRPSQARFSRQTANQLLHHLEPRGLIVSAYGQFAILDWVRLDQFANADPEAAFMLTPTNEN